MKFNILMPEKKTNITKEEKEFIHIELSNKFDKLFLSLEKNKEYIFNKFSEMQIKNEKVNIYTMLGINGELNNLKPIIEKELKFTFETGGMIENVFVNDKLSNLDSVIGLFFSGVLIMGDNNYKFKFKLEEDNRYFDVISDISNSSYISGIELSKIDLKYIKRMYKIVITECEYLENKEIYFKDCEINYDFGIFSKILKLNVNVFFNVSKTKLISESDIVLDKVKHTFTIDDDIYLLRDNIKIYDYFIYTKNNICKLEFLNDLENRNIYEFYIIHNIQYKKDRFKYAILTEYILNEYMKKNNYSKYFNYKLEKGNVILDVLFDDIYIEDMFLEIKDDLGGVILNDKNK